VPALPHAGAIGPTPGRPHRRSGPDAAAKAAAAARALAWAHRHPEIDARMVLDFADAAHADRDGIGCLTALKKIPADAWPATLGERAERRRATCEMLRGNCDKGRLMLAPLDGGSGSRTAMLANCPIASLPTVEDRILAVSAQADDARYAGNKPARRAELKQALQRQTASPEIQACFRNRHALRACGRLLAALTRAYQVLAESFFAGRDCVEGAALDVMRSQVKFQSVGAEGGDPALRCRSERVFAMYRSCAEAGEAAERRCLARVQAARRDGVSVLPDAGR